MYHFFEILKLKFNYIKLRKRKIYLKFLSTKLMKSMLWQPLLLTKGKQT